MATLRPTVAVFNGADGKPTGRTVATPAVFKAPLRPDLVDFVHHQMSNNRKQAYAVSRNAGYQTAAESWGTGRAVARIPRVPGGGTHRAGQAAFGNMCRGGGMFNPTKTWRRWHRRINVTQKRHAVCAAIASSALPALVMARGHRIDEVSEMPIVVDNSLESCKKTKEAVSILEKLGLGADLKKVVDSKKIRAGKGKARNRRYSMRRGPLVVYGANDGIQKALRNVLGVETQCANRLNLLELCPGGHLGRAVVYTESAMEMLKEIYGNGVAATDSKKGYSMPRAVMTNPDLHRLINSEEIQSVVRPMREAPARYVQKKNPLKNKALMDKLNPGSGLRRRNATAKQTKGSKVQEAVSKKTKVTKEKKKAVRSLNKAFFKKMKDAHTPKVAEVAADEE